MATSDGNIRVSDAERDHVIDLLRQHTADGRLRIDEFEERVSEALAARTRAELEPVLRELPPLVVSPPPPAPRSRPAWTSAVNGRTITALAAVVVATFLVTQGAWWVVFPLIAVFGGCGRSRTCAVGSTSTAPARDATSADDRDIIHV